VLCDARGNLFVVDTENHAIRRIDAQTGIITYGRGRRSRQPRRRRPATRAGLDRPHGVALDPRTGALLIADSNNHRVRCVTPAGKP
jgi:DNA-binding beta-propeller fold protein YncE